MASTGGALVRLSFAIAAGCAALASTRMPAAGVCTGDCDADGIVAIDEVTSCILVVAGARAADGCAACGDGDQPAIDDLTAAIGHALHGCDPLSAPTPTPSATPAPSRSARGTPGRVTPRGGPTATPPVGGCTTVGGRPCIARAPVTVGPCAALPLTGDQATGTTIGGSNVLGNGEELSCGNNGGGRDAPERVYIFTPPAPGQYEIAVQGDKFRPLLHLRRQSCQGAFLACADDPTTARRPSLTVDVVAPIEPIAIGVDGDGSTQRGTFTLRIRPRLPDLVIDTVAGPALVNAGEQVAVSTRVRNRGDAPAGPFRVVFSYAANAALSEGLGAPTSCEVAGLAPGASTECAAPAGLRVPRITAGSYFLVARADAADQVIEVDEDNNIHARPAPIRVRGARLEQRLFRATDGTAYQLVRVVPVDELTSAEYFHVNQVAGSRTGGIDAQASTATTIIAAGFETDYFARVTGGPQSTSIRRTAVLRPNDDAVSFSPFGGGRLALGSENRAGGDAVARPPLLGICREASDCFAVGPITALALAPVTSVGGGIGAACTTGAALTFSLPGGAAAGGACSFPAKLTQRAKKCQAAPADGFTLAAGEAVVFVHDQGIEAVDPFSAGVAAFGINTDRSDNCSEGQIVDVAALRSDSGQQELLTFVDLIANRGAAPSAVAVSADGANVYVPSSNGGGLVGFRRDPATSRLVPPFQIVRQGVNGVTGLNGAAGMTVSADNRHAYVASSIEQSVTVFSRNPTTGELGFLDVVRYQNTGSFALRGAYAVLLSPDDRHLYVVGRSRAFPDVFPELSITAFARNPSTGLLQLLSAFGESVLPGSDVDAGLGPVALAMSSDGRFLYMLSADLRRLEVLERDPASGALSIVQRVSGGGASIAISPSGAFVYTADPANSTVSVFQRDAATGSISGIQDLSNAETPALSGAGAVAVAADGRTVYVTTPTALLIFAADAAGRLAFVDQVPLLAEPARSQSLAVVQEGNRRSIYVAKGTPADIVMAYEHLATAPLPVLVSRQEPSFVDGLDGVSAVAVSPDGGHVYAAGPDALVTLAREPDSGQLSFVEALRPAGGVTALAVSPDSRHVYSSGSGGLRSFSRNAASGQLTTLQVDTGLGAARALSITPDGVSLFAAVGTAIVSRTRNTTSGVLLGSASFETGSTVNALLAQDARVFYAGDVAAFAARGFSGLTRPPGPLSDPAVGGSRTIAVADEVYVTTNVSGANGQSILANLHIFQPQGSVLQPIDTVSAATVQGLANSTAMASSPDGRYLFITARSADPLLSGDTLIAFATGGRRLVDIKRDGGGSVDGLAGPAAVAVSRDGRHVYAAASTDDALSIFAVNQPVALPTASPTATTVVVPATPTPTPTMSGAYPNDLCQNAISLVQGQTMVIERAELATQSPGDPVPGCGNNSRAHSLWYRVSNGTFLVLTRGSTYDTIVSAFTGTCGALVPVANTCNDDEIPEIRTSRLQSFSLNSETHYIMVTSFDGSGGELRISLRNDLLLR